MPSKRNVTIEEKPKTNLTEQIRVRVPEGMKELLSLIEEHEGVSQSELIREALKLLVAQKCVMTHGQLEKRFGLAKGTVATKNSRVSREEFAEWSRQQDPDGIAWVHVPNEKFYQVLTDIGALESH
jgi:Arc/MetJ-type ribon-helix-helix transcriptional regulator